MSTPTIHVPPREVETIVYSTAYLPGPPGCAVCGEPTAPFTDEQRYCSRSHKTIANRIRSGRKEGVLPVDPPKGTCHYCGATLPPPSPFERRRTCARLSCRKAYGGKHGFRVFCRLVKRPHPLSWLGPKLNLAPDDPRLPQLALLLAEKGKLGVYVRADGTIGEVGRLKEKKR
jgi:hypothetical protein